MVSVTSVQAAQSKKGVDVSISTFVVLVETRWMYEAPSYADRQAHHLKCLQVTVL